MKVPINTKLTYTTIKQTDPCETDPREFDCGNGKCIYTFENGRSCECNDGWTDGWKDGRMEKCKTKGTRRQNVKISNHLLDLMEL